MKENIEEKVSERKKGKENMKMSKFTYPINTMLCK